MRHSPQIVVRARQMYADGVPVGRIARECGLSQDRLYYWIDGGPLDGDLHLPPLPRRRVNVTADKLVRANATADEILPTALDADEPRLNPNTDEAARSNVSPEGRTISVASDGGHGTAPNARSRRAGVSADRGVAPAADQRRLDVPPASRRRRRLSGDRVALVGRLWRAAEAQVRDIEERLLRIGQAPDERERDGRTLAVLVKTLRELTTLDQVRTASADDKDARCDDDVPTDVDELRRELARRIDRLRQGRAATEAAGASGADTP